MLSYSELEKGIIFILDGEPYEVLESSFVRMQQRKAVVQTKIRNLINGKVVSRTIHPSETFEKAEIEKREAVFVFSHRGQFTFKNPNDPKERFNINEKLIGDKAIFLKPGLPITILEFNGKMINIALPIKVDYKVMESPPNIKGNTASGSGKTVKLENGLELIVPLFINEGDIIRVNTETGQYVERIEKSDPICYRRITS